MLEIEMEDLLWMYPDKFLEPLKQFRRQPRSAVGRADLVFEDRLGRLLVVEIKRGTLPRGAIDQVHDYFGYVKNEFPDKPVEMMVIAQSIPQERRTALELYNIDYREISEKRFRDVALETGYVFQSERQSEACAGVTRDVATPESSKTVTVPESSEDLKAELKAVVNAYVLTAAPDALDIRGTDPSYRVIIPPRWKRKHLHYELRQVRDQIGAELHIAGGLSASKAVSIGEFLKRFAGRTVADGAGELIWDEQWGAGRGRLAAIFRLPTSPETVAAGMRDLILMTRSGVSEYL